MIRYVRRLNVNGGSESAEHDGPQIQRTFFSCSLTGDGLPAVIAFRKEDRIADYESPIRVIAASWDSAESRGSRADLAVILRRATWEDTVRRVSQFEDRGPRFGRRKWKINMYSPASQSLLSWPRPRGYLPRHYRHILYLNRPFQIEGNKAVSGRMHLQIGNDCLTSWKLEWGSFVVQRVGEVEISKMSNYGCFLFQFGEVQISKMSQRRYVNNNSNNNLNNRTSPKRRTTVQ